MPEGIPVTPQAGQSKKGALTRELYEAYREEADNHGWRERALKSDKFFKGIQWESADIEELKARGEAPLVHPETERIIRGKIALMTARQPTFSVIGREDSDASMARLLAKLLQWHVEVSGGNIIFDTALHHWAHRGGRGILFSWFDPNADFGKGEVFTKAIEDPIEVYVDPNSKDYLWRDAQHIVLRRILTRGQALDIWPDKKAVIDKAREYDHTDRPSSTHGYRERDGSTTPPPLVGDTDQDRYHKKHEILERYTKVRRRFVRVFHSGEEDIMPEAEHEAWLQGTAYVIDDGEDHIFAVLGRAHEEAEATYNQLAEALGAAEGEPVMFHLAPMVDPETGQGDFVTVPGPEDENGVPNSTVIISPVAREALDTEIVTVPHTQIRIERHTTIGDLDLDEAELPYDEYPITPIQNGWSGNPFPTDDVDKVRSIQEQINFTEQKITKHLASSAGTKIIAPQGFFAQDPTAEDKMGAPGTSVIYGNYAPDQQPNITVITPAQLANELYLQKDRLVRTMERILGYYEFQAGSVEGAHDTAAGTLALDQFAQRGVAGDLRKLEVSLSHHGRVVLQMYQKHITTQKVIRLANPFTQQEEAFTLNYEDFTDEGRRINDITVGRYDVRVVASSMLPENSIAKADFYASLYQMGAIDQEELLKKLQEFDSAAILERTAIVQQQAQQIEALQEEVKRLQGDMQTADRELRTADRRVDAQKFRTKLDKIASGAEADRKVGSARINDLVSQTKSAEA